MQRNAGKPEKFAGVLFPMGRAALLRRQNKAKQQLCPTSSIKNLACDRENSDIIEDFQLVPGFGRR
jgi:hypothetical protein